MSPPVVFGKETSYSCGPGMSSPGVSKGISTKRRLSCAQDRTGQEAPPLDSCALILLEPRLLRPKYMQRGDSAPPKTCTRMYTLETRGPFLRSYSLEKLENAGKQDLDSLSSARIKRVRALLEVYLRRTTGGFPSPVGPAIGDVLLLWTRQ